MMEQQAFEDLVKDILTNLYDTTALETHPLLFSVIKPPPGYTQRKSDFVRQVIEEAIQKLRPDRKEESLSAPEWRPYLILQRRYVDGMGLQELATSLAISDRQMRRDHHRALCALAAVLWENLFPGQSNDPIPDDASEETGEEDSQSFEVHNEVIGLQETLDGVYRILRARMEEEGVNVLFEPSSTPLMINTDRVVLRQIFISLFHWASHVRAQKEIRVRWYPAGQQAVIEFDVPVNPGSNWKKDTKEEALPDAASYWAARIDARLEDAAQVENYLHPHVEHGPGMVYARRSLRLQRHGEQVALVIDDQGAAISLFQRLLAVNGYTVVGTNRAGDALQTARQLQPALVILDVMMPQMDGWEVLQTLKLDEETCRIPILICSAWEEPELSRSLGAAGFLKKPVTLKNLQEALKKLSL